MPPTAATATILVIVAVAAVGSILLPSVLLWLQWEATSSLLPSVLLWLQWEGRYLLPAAGTDLPAAATATS